MGVAKNLLTKNRDLIREQSRCITLNELRHILRKSNPNCCPAGDTWIFTMEGRLIMIHNGDEEWEVIISGEDCHGEAAQCIIEQNFTSQHPELITASDILPVSSHDKWKDLVICDDSVLYDRTSTLHRYVDTSSLSYFSMKRFDVDNAYTRITYVEKMPPVSWYYLPVPYSRGDKSRIFQIEQYVDEKEGKDFYYSRYTPESMLRSIFNTFHHATIQACNMPIRSEMCKKYEAEEKEITTIVRTTRRKKFVNYLSDETMNAIMSWFNGIYEGMDPIEFERRERRMFRTHANAVLAGLARATHVGGRNEKVFQMYLRSAEKQAADERAREERARELEQQREAMRQMERDRQANEEKIRLHNALAKRRKADEEATLRRYNIPVGAIIVQDRELRYAFEETKYWPIKARFFDKNLETFRDIFAEDSIVHIDVDTASLIVIRELNLIKGFAHIIMVKQYNSATQHSGILSPFKTSRLWRISGECEATDIKGTRNAYHYQVPLVGLSSKSTNKPGMLEFTRKAETGRFQYTWVAIETVIPFRDLLGSSKIPSESDYAQLIDSEFWEPMTHRAFVYHDYGTGVTTSKCGEAVGIIRYNLGDLMKHNGTMYHRTWSRIRNVENDLFLSKSDEFEKHQQDALQNIQSIDPPMKLVL